MPFEAQLRYQVCPIILTGGVAQQIPGGMLPMLSLFAQGSELMLWVYHLTLVI